MNVPVLTPQTLTLITLHGYGNDSTEYTIPADKIAMIETKQKGNETFTRLTISTTGEKILVTETQKDIIDLFRCCTRVDWVSH